MSFDIACPNCKYPRLEKLEMEHAIFSTWFVCIRCASVFMNDGYDLVQLGKDNSK